MNDIISSGFSRRVVLLSAFKYSVPVLLGYSTIGIAFGLVVSGTGYPWWLATVMSLWMFAGAGQFIAAGLFAAGTTLFQACFIQLVVNARHIAYGFSMFKRFEKTGPLKPYMIFSLSDETFALLSSMSERTNQSDRERRLFMFYVALLDQFYWVAGTIIGAVAGSLIPFDFEGVGFALTALFVVLMLEQIKKVKKAGLFIVSAFAALAGVFLLPLNISLLFALIIALFISPFVVRGGEKA